MYFHFRVEILVQKFILTFFRSEIAIAWLGTLDMLFFEILDSFSEIWEKLPKIDIMVIIDKGLIQT